MEEVELETACSHCGETIYLPLDVVEQAIKLYRWEWDWLEVVDVPKGIFDEDESNIQRIRKGGGEK